MKEYTEEEIKQVAEKLINLSEGAPISPELWEEIQAVSAYVLNKYYVITKKTE